MMKRFLIACLVLGLARPVSAQAHVQSAKHSVSSGINNDTPMPGDITSGNWIVYCISGGSSFNTAALTPSNLPTLQSGTATISAFTQRPTATYVGVNNGATNAVADAACWTATVTGTGSATFRDTTGLDQYHTAVVAEFSGVTGIEGITSGFGLDASPTLTVTNTTANSLLVVFQIDEGDRTNTSPTGMTLTWTSRQKTVPASGAPVFDLVTAPTTVGAANVVTWALGGGTDAWATIGFALAGSGGAAAGPCLGNLLRIGCEN